jgi:hypothetical protein
VRPPKAVIVSDVTETPKKRGGPRTGEIEALGVPTRFVRTDVSKKIENDALVDAATEFGAST